MKRTSISTVVLLGMTLAATPAFAITVTNQDKGEHTLTVDKGETETDQKLAGGASTEVDCQGGCELRVKGSGYGRSVEKGDKLVIKDGMIAFAAETTGSTKAPSGTKAR